MNDCRFSPDRCEDCARRGHLPKCRQPAFAGGQGRTPEEIASIGASLWRAFGVAVALLLAACCAGYWGAG